MSGDTPTPPASDDLTVVELGRRQFLTGLAGVAFGPAFGPAFLPRLIGPAAAGPAFLHGVASGDPTPEGVVLWTRVTQEGGDDIPVQWVVASDPALSRVVASGTTVAAAERDHTTHVPVGGLAPGTTYHFRFEALGQMSPVGRTRTAAAGGSERVRFGVCSCARYSDGYYTAYAGLAAADVDLVVHLGDYIYEEAGEGPRSDGPGTPALAVTLADYRARFAESRGDPQLQELHRLHPMAAVWDDHEFADNTWRDGAPGHDEAEHGPWADRREAAARAWREWMPVRLPDPEDPLRIWRALPYGDLVDLVLLDTRLHGRDRPVTQDSIDRLDAPERSMLGAAQEGWLARRLAEPGPTWLLLANQVVLTPLPLNLPDVLPDGAAEDAGLVSRDGTVFNADQWDGYPAARRRLIEILAGRPGGGVAVLTGDIHSSFALELAGPGGEPVATEVVVPSVTSGSLGERLGPVADVAFDKLAGNQKAIRWSDLFEHGFAVVEATPARLCFEWWHVDGIDRPEGTWSFAAGWQRTPDAARFTAMETPTAASAASLAARRPRPAGGDDAWFDPLLSAPAGAGALAAGVAGLVVFRRRQGRRPDTGDAGGDG